MQNQNAAPRGWSEVEASDAPMLRKGDATPWGYADSVTMLTDGLYCIGAPGHGGYAVSPAMLLRLCNSGDGDTAKRTIELRDRIKDRLFVHRHGRDVINWYWFEEDCDWSILCLLVAKNGSQAVKDAWSMNSPERQKEMNGAAWCTVQNFHPTLQEDLRLI